MLYHLFYQGLSSSVSWLNVFKYQTFRAMAAFLFAFVFVLVFEPLFIRWLTQRGVKGQPIREDGPKDHSVKRGTPTMGGLVIIAGVLLSSLLFCDLTNLHVWLTLAAMVSLGYVGFLDDWSKITKQNTTGLSERQKLLAQGVVGASVGLALIFSGYPDTLLFPFFKSLHPSLGILFIPFVIVVITGTSNAVNLTDGLDGLAIGPVMTVAFAYAIFCYATGHAQIAHYLQLEHIPQLGEVAILLAAVVAGGMGFLWYNTFPAQVFMGDTGALALGGVLGVVAVLAKQEIVLVLCGGVFVIEALSVLIQRYYFKLTKKRVFRMAPLHHHFELLGLAEPKIIVRAWIISIFLALLSLATLKLR